MSAAWPSSENESGLEIEESLRTKLETFSERKISWKRLAVTGRQFRLLRLGDDYPTSGNGTEPESLPREIEECL